MIKKIGMVKIAEKDIEVSGFYFDGAVVSPELVALRYAHCRIGKKIELLEKEAQNNNRRSGNNIGKAGCINDGCLGWYF